MKSAIVEADLNLNDVMEGFDMNTAIKVSGRNISIKGNVVKSNGDGIVADGEEIKISDNVVEISEANLIKIIKQLNLPENLPHQHLIDAMKALSGVTESKDAELKLDSSDLKEWLCRNGFNMSFWVSTVISLLSFIKP